MQTEAADSIDDEVDARLADDARWQLVQRIVRSRTMQRASHLKKILLFVAETSLLHPDTLIREQDIAHRVLGRKEDFDPAYDTIVRVQIGHLRQKLQTYFENEGASEPLRLTLPRGSYRTVFEEVALPPATVEEPTSVIAESVLAEPMMPRPEAKRRFWPWVACAALLLCAAAASLLWWRSHRIAASEDPSIANRMFPYLAKGGKVSVVLPDTSLLLIQKIFYTDIPVEVYGQSGNRTVFGSQTEDQKFSQLLTLLGRVRTTTLDEASVGTDFLQALTRAGMQAELRYARDLHIRDFGQGSYILIGNQRSDPWVSLFATRSNFQYTGQPAGHSYAFHNVNPLKGERADYAPIEGDVESFNYADITLTPNLTDSGYVLTIVGSDVPANEAAARFLMGAMSYPKNSRPSSKKEPCVALSSCFVATIFMANPMTNSLSWHTASPIDNASRQNPIGRAPPYEYNQATEEILFPIWSSFQIVSQDGCAQDEDRITRCFPYQGVAGCTRSQQGCR